MSNLHKILLWAVAMVITTVAVVSSSSYLWGAIIVVACIFISLWAVMYVIKHKYILLLTVPWGIAMMVYDHYDSVVNSSYLDHHIGEYIVIGFVGTMAGVLVAALISLTFQKTEDIDVGDLEDHD